MKMFNVIALLVTFSLLVGVIMVLNLFIENLFFSFFCVLSSIVLGTYFIYLVRSLI